jgi:hypothetical protein
MYKSPSSDGKAITAIARAHGHRVTETSVTRPSGDHGGALTGEAGDPVDARGVEGFRQGHRRHHGREAAGQYRFARPEITIHCRHRHPLRSVDRQVPLQRSELKALGLSD